MRIPAIILTLGLILSLHAGCGKKIDTHKTAEQVRTEVASMSASQIEAEAKAYIKEIQRTRTSFEKTRSKLQGLPPQEIFGEKARSLQKEMTDITRRVSDLTECYQIYADKYEELGGDAAKIRIG